MNTITLSSTGQYWTATPGFADELNGLKIVLLHLEIGAASGQRCS